MAEEWAMLRIKRSTKEELNKIGLKTDSYDNIIKKLLKFAIKKRELNGIAFDYEFNLREIEFNLREIEFNLREIENQKFWEKKENKTLKKLETIRNNLKTA